MGDHTIDAGLKALSILATMRNRPSAVLCSNDMTAIGVMRAAFDLGLKNIPQDLSVIGFDDIRLGAIYDSTTYHGAVVADRDRPPVILGLLDSLDPRRGGSIRQVYSIKTNLVLRHSTALAPGCIKNISGNRILGIRLGIEACPETAIEGGPKLYPLNHIENDQCEVGDGKHETCFLRCVEMS